MFPFLVGVPFIGKKSVQFLGGFYLVAASSGIHVDAGNRLYCCHYSDGGRRLDGARRFQFELLRSASSLHWRSELLFVGSFCGPGQIFENRIQQSPDRTSNVLPGTVSACVFGWFL